MTTHTEAREFARNALITVFGTEPSRGEIAALAGVAFLKTAYGAGWKGAGRGSHNQVAVQCGPGPGWKGARFSSVDTQPNNDGSNTTYWTDFRKYPTLADAWFDACKVVYVNRGRQSVRDAAIAENWLLCSARLRGTGFYEGVGRTQEDRVRNHCRMLTRAIELADAEAAAQSHAAPGYGSNATSDK
jgi:hypothetical protein